MSRFLQLVRSIHQSITAEEERKSAELRAAESLANEKNKQIMSAVQEVVEFCQLLQKVPELEAVLREKTHEITDKIYSDRSEYSIETDSISVHYDMPVYQVDMHEPDHIRLVGETNAFLDICFNPVKFSIFECGVSDGGKVTQYLLKKQYRISPIGKFHRLTGDNPAPVDPIAEIITELRLKLGFEFFENNLLPFMESCSERERV